jgi:hypothetical protein
MFVAVACDLGNADHRDSVHNLLLQYGCKKLQEGLYESASTRTRWARPWSCPRCRRKSGENWY